MACLSTDEDILAAIFNPEFPLGLGGAPAARAPVLAAAAAASAAAAAESPGDEEAALRVREAEGARCAEEGRLEDALRIFTEVVAAGPQRASGYNNRAQALQLLGRPADALSDLDRALALPSIPEHVARKAFFQRAMLKRLQGDDDGARADFEAAASLGDEAARREAAKLNPYAAMCNQMLSSVMSSMRQEQQPFSSKDCTAARP